MLTELTDVILIVVAAILIGVYVSWRAGRLDRLHARVEAARAALDAALVRRSAVALELAAGGLLDPATSLLIAGAAHDARAAGEPDERAESDLTRALRAALSQPGFRTALAARAGWTGSTPAWWPSGPRSTRPWSGAVRWRSNWPPVAS